MTAETQVVKEVSEVCKVEIEENCGLDMTSYQDLSKSNGINNVGGNADDDPDTRDASIDNSYVFVNGTDDDSAHKLIPVEESKVSHESVSASQNHVNSEEENIESNEDILKHSSAENKGIVHESDADPVNNVDSPRKNEGDEVQVTMTGSEDQHDRIVANADAKPEPVKDHMESESSAQPIENQESQAAIIDSVEQPNGIITPNTDTKPEQLEVSVQPTENKASEVVVLEANAESGGCEEPKSLLPETDDAVDENKEIKEANLQTPDEMSRGQDSQIVVSEMNVESGSTKESKSASPDTNQTGNENQETKQSNLDASDDLSQGQDSEVGGLEVNAGSREESKIVSLGMKEYGDGSKGIDEVQECKNVVSKMDIESGDGGELKIPSPDVKETSDEIKESGDKNSGISHELTEVQESQNVIAETAEYQSTEIESSKINLEEQKDFEMHNESMEGHESQNVASEASIYQSAEVPLKNGNVEEGNSLHSTKDLRDKGKPENVIIEASGCQSGKLDVGLSDESVEGCDLQHVALDTPESVSEEVEVETLNSEQQCQRESLQPADKSGNSLVPGAVSLELGSWQHDDGGEKKLDQEEKTVLCSNGKEINVSDTALNQDIHTNLEVKSSVNETDTPLEAENGRHSVLDENKDDLDVPHISECAKQTDAPNGCADGSENSVAVNGASVSDHSLAPAQPMRSETEITGKPVESDERAPSGSRDVTTVHHEIKPQASTQSDAKYTKDIVPCSVDNTKADLIESETVVVNGFIDGHSISSYPVSDEGLGTESALENIDLEEKNCSFQGEDVHFKTKDLSGDFESPHTHSLSADVKLDSQVEGSRTVGSRDMLSNDLDATGNVVDSSAVKKESALNFVAGTADVEIVDDEFNDVDRNGERIVICQESSDIEKSHITEVAASTPESSSADAMAGQESMVEVMTRPFNFLIKIPRFDDEKLRERIRHAQLQVEEKTQRRDAFRLEIQKKKSNLQAYGVEFEAAIAEEREARRLVKKKRIEIESLQSVINRAKNAISVKNIDAQVLQMEHKIQHETQPLKEEKEIIREIKRLNQLREQLSSNNGSKDEVQQALDQKDQIEDRLKVLKKELESLKNRVSKAEAVATTARRKYDEENKRFKELQNQFKAADDIRQAAYAQLLSLRRELFEKNKQFRMYRDDAAAGSDYALNRNREALHRLCVNQVETIMELWNKNDEFRKEYLRCNLRSTVRRLGTLDGRSLGPDEEPPVVPSYADERVGRLIFTPDKRRAVSQTAVEQKTEVTPVGGVVADKSMTKVAESVKQTVKKSEPAKSTLENGLPSSSAEHTTTTNDSKEEHLQTKVEPEFVRRAEELRKKEEAAKLKELRRLEEIAKAREALERKRRIAEKAQMRAELRAQKEAEQKEKEREKRMRKKERKKAVEAEAHEGNNNNNGESAESCESSAMESVKDPEMKESPPATVTKRAQKASQFVKQSKSKSIPPPLRNRSRRKMQQWLWVILTSIVVIALFLLGNIGVFNHLRPRKSGL